MNEKWTHRSIALALLSSLIVTFWKVSAVIGALESWQVMNQPKVAGDLMQAGVYGLVALGLGLGLNVSTLIRGLGVPAPNREDS